MKKPYAALSFIFFLALLVSAAYADTSYILKKGDTLRKLAKRYHTTTSAIKRANNLKSGKLSAGTKLVIPDAKSRKKRGRAKKTTRTAAASNVSSEKKESSGEATYYTVKKGDTLRAIAGKHSMTAGELKMMNSLRRGRIKVGQKLRVRDVEPKTYVVKKGDTLRKISRRFKISTDKLKEINELQGASLKPGRRIFLAGKPGEPKENPGPLGTTYDRRETPVITSAKLEEVKEMSKSDELLSDLSIKERLILFAKKMLHLPYRFGGTGAFGLDCSGYVQKAYGFVGQTLPRSAREQFRIGEAIDKKDLLSGDLVFFRTYASFPSHVGIYLGNNLFIHASSLSKKITIDSLESPYYFKRFIGAKRVIPEEDTEAEDDDPPAKDK